MCLIARGDIGDGGLSDGCPATATPHPRCRVISDVGVARGVACVIAERRAVGRGTGELIKIYNEFYKKKKKQIGGIVGGATTCPWERLQLFSITNRNKRERQNCLENAILMVFLNILFFLKDQFFYFYLFYFFNIHYPSISTKNYKNTNFFS